MLGRLRCIPKAEWTERRAVYELGHGGDGTFETGWRGDLDGREKEGELEGDVRALEGKLRVIATKYRQSGALPLMPVSTLASVYQKSIQKHIALMHAAKKQRVINPSNERLSGVSEYKTPVSCGN